MEHESDSDWDIALIFNEEFDEEDDILEEALFGLFVDYIDGREEEIKQLARKKFNIPSEDEIDLFIVFRHGRMYSLVHYKTETSRLLKFDQDVSVERLLGKCAIECN